MDLPILNNPARPGELADGLAQLSTSTSGCAPAPLPMTMKDAKARGWAELDVVFITGDAYIDHPSFAMAILGRVLEAAGYRVGIVSQAYLSAN